MDDQLKLSQEVEQLNESKNNNLIKKVKNYREDKKKEEEKKKREEKEEIREKIRKIIDKIDKETEQIINKNENELKGIIESQKDYTDNIKKDEQILFKNKDIDDNSIEIISINFHFYQKQKNF